MKNVYLIEDCQVLAESIGSTLNSLGYRTHVFSDPQAFMAEPELLSPAVVVLDMRLPTMSGLDLQKLLIQKNFQTPIIFISGDFQSQEIVSAMKQGAIEFLFKPFGLDELLSAIDTGLKQDEAQQNKRTTRITLESKYNSLTPREKEVCIRLANGLLSKQVAAELNISTATIKVHKSRIFEKMDTQSLQELALMLRELEIIQ